MLLRGTSEARRLILATLIVTGCSASGSVATDTRQASPAPAAPESAAASDSATVSEGPSESPSGAFQDIELTGKGDKVAKFTIPEETPAIADVTHRGKANFAITTIDGAGDHLDLLVNTIGDYQGTVLFDEAPESHAAALEITADGTWAIIVKPVTDSPTWDLGAALQGIGDSVYQVSPSSGLVTLDVENKGEGNFAVIAFSADRQGSLLVNEIGDYRGQVLLPDGTVLLEITSDGTWSARAG
jgi:hypothetical protein